MIVFLIILLGAVLYSVPGLIATGRQHPQAWRIWLVNLLLGFTVVGWLWSLREALRADAVPYRKVYYRYSYYGEESRKKRFDFRQLPLGDVGMAVVGLAVVALVGTFAWRHYAPEPATAEAAAATVATSQGWNYTLENSETGPVHVSTLISDDAVATDDRIPAALVLRNGPDEPSAAIRIDGQFTCSAAANGTITAQFDGGQAETLHCAPRPASLSNVGEPGQDMLFVANPEAFISRARSARSLVLTANVFGQGVKSARFSPQGLDIAMAGLSEEATIAEATARPAAAAVPVALQTAAAGAPEPARTERAMRTTKVAAVAKVRPTKMAPHRTAHHDRQTVLHPFRPQPHHKSWRD